MALKKILPEDLAGKGVQGQQDTPGLKTSEMQAKIEEIVRSVVIPAFNENASNTYDKTEVADQIAQKIIEIGAGDMAKSVYDRDGDGVVDNSKALDGKTANQFATATQGVAARAYKADQASGSSFKLGDVNQQAEILATTDLNILFKFHSNLIYALYLGEYGKNGPWSLCPNGDNSLSLGNASARWKSLYAASGTIQTSDLRKKTDIAPLTKATDFIMRLRPISYKMIDGETGRTHWGLGAQDVQQAMQESGLSDMDFAGFIRSPRMENVDTGVQDKDGNPITEKRVIPNEYEYGLRYEEFIAPLIATVQAQQCAIDDLTERVAALEQKW